MEKISNQEIDQVENELGARLPGLYRKLLVEEGYGRSASGEAELYAPLTIRDQYKKFFLEPEKGLNPYFPIGYNKLTHEIWVLDAEKELAASIPDEKTQRSLDDCDVEWLAYEDWTIQFFDPMFPYE